jgi:hypothetical protein
VNSWKLSDFGDAKNRDNFGDESSEGFNNNVKAFTSENERKLG